VSQLFANLVFDEAAAPFYGSTDSQEPSYSAKQTFTQATDFVALLSGAVRNRNTNVGGTASGQSCIGEELAKPPQADHTSFCCND
jgi:hypothetical protein